MCPVNDYSFEIDRYCEHRMNGIRVRQKQRLEDLLLVLLVVTISSFSAQASSPSCSHLYYESDIPYTAPTDHQPLPRHFTWPKPHTELASDALASLDIYIWLFSSPVVVLLRRHADTRAIKQSRYSKTKHCRMEKYVFSPKKKKKRIEKYVLWGVGDDHRNCTRPQDSFARRICL